MDHLKFSTKNKYSGVKEDLNLMRLSMLWSGVDSHELAEQENNEFLNLIPIESLNTLLDETKSNM